MWKYGRRLYLVILLAAVGMIQAQVPPPAPPASAASQLAEKKPDYSKEAFLGEQDQTRIVFENDGTGTRETTARVRIQSDAAIQRYGVLTFPYESGTQSLEIDYVRVRKPDGTVIASPPENIQDMPAEITRQAPFYSDLREKHVAVKGLSVGDVLETQTHWHTTKPLAPGQFWLAFNFTHDAIVLDQELEISVPRERDIKWKSPGYKPVISDEGSRRVFAWKYSQLEQKPADEQKKEQDNQAYQLARGKLPGPDVQVSTFRSWEEIGDWYNKLQLDRVKPNPEIQAKAVEITKNAADEDAKVRAIYNYVSTQFRYIGVAFGIGRYQPHFAAEVLGNQYGDCKDKHTLLAALLQAAGIKAYPALINTFHEVDQDVPSPSQFDHVITAVPQGTGYLWLDTTAEVAPYGYLLGVLRDKQALVIPAEKPALLITTPTESPIKGSERFRIDAKLKEDGTLQGRIERAVSGNDTEILIREAFRRTPVTQWNNLVQQISYNSGFAGEVSEVTASAPEKIDTPFTISYSYSRKDFPQWSERRISLPLPPLLGAIPDSKPSHPIFLGPIQEYKNESDVELPQGFSPQLPRSVDVKEDFAEYHAAYSFAHGKLRTERTLIVKKQEVPVDGYESYKKFVKVVADDYERFVELSFGNSSYNPLQRSVAQLEASDNAEAMDHYSSAMSEIRVGDVPGAINSLNDAVKADPKFAWVTLAQLYVTTGDKSKALETLERGYRADPDEPVIYKALVAGLMGQQEYAKAVSVLQEIVKAEPDNGDAFSMLGNALSAAKRYSEAAAAEESAIKLNPEHSVLYAQLGFAYLRAGNEEKAVTAYKKALELEPSSLMFNDIGYELADSNTDLPLALEYVERAVREEEEASSKVKLSDLKTEDLGHTSKLAAFWDSLGWVYFRMGSLDQAEKYLDAAWQLSESAVIGDHLGQVYEQEHKKEKAIRTYRLALSTSMAPDEMPETKARLEKLAGTTKDPAGWSGAEELSALRTIKLDGVKTETGSAEFFLLMARDSKVEDSKILHSSEKLKSPEKILGSAAFKIPFPDDGPTLLLRNGVLSCSSLGCQVVLYTPGSVRSVD